jgi:ribosomal protein S25
MNIEDEHGIRPVWKTERLEKRRKRRKWRAGEVKREGNWQDEKTKGIAQHTIY